MNDGAAFQNSESYAQPQSPLPMSGATCISSHMHALAWGLLMLCWLAGLDVSDLLLLFRVWDSRLSPKDRADRVRILPSLP